MDRFQTYCAGEGIPLDNEKRQEELKGEAEAMRFTFECLYCGIPFTTVRGLSRHVLGKPDRSNHT